MLKNTVVTTILTSLYASVAIPVLAQEAIMRVPARRARGIESKVVEVKVYPYSTGSTIINFRPTGEKIRQVSLVADSLLLSSDDPDCLSSQAKQSGQACAATLLYLQQKPQKTVPNSTRMSVLSDQNIYVFQIVLSSGTPTYSVVEIQPDTRQYTPLVSLEQITTLVKGFQVAVEQQYVSNPEFNSRIRKFLDLARSEKTLESAAAQAGISMEVVQKLQELGNRQPVREQPSQSPTPVLQ